MPIETTVIMSECAVQRAMPFTRVYCLILETSDFGRALSNSNPRMGSVIPDWHVRHGNLKFGTKS